MIHIQLSLFHPMSMSGFVDSDHPASKMPMEALEKAFVEGKIYKETIVFVGN